MPDESRPPYPDTIRPVLQALSDPVPLARSLGLLKRKHFRQGRGLSVLCPLHGEKHHPSLSLQLYPDGRLGWLCFACQAHGDALDLIARIGLGLDPTYRRSSSDLRRVLAWAYHLAGLVPPASLSPFPTLSPTLHTPPPPSPTPTPPGFPDPSSSHWMGEEPTSPPGPPLKPTPHSVDPVTLDLAARALLTACPLAGSAAASLAQRGVLAEALADGWGELPESHATAPSRADLAPEPPSPRLQAPPGPHGALLAWWAAFLRQLPPDHQRALGWLGHPGQLLRPSHRLLLPWRRLDGSLWAVQRRHTPPLLPPPAPDGLPEAVTHGPAPKPPPSDREPKYVMPPAAWTGGEAWPYGIDHADLRSAHEVWLCEGAIDVLALRALNRRRSSPRPLAVLGLPGVARWHQALAPALPWLRGRHVVLALDADRAGRQAIAALAAAMHEAGASLVSDKLPPAGAKDWADVTASLHQQGQLR